MTPDTFQPVRFRIAGDRGILVEYGDTIDAEVNRRVRSMAMALKQDTPMGITEVIPTYRSLLIIYNPLKTRPFRIQEELRQMESKLSEIRIPPPKRVEIPVCYGGEYGPDLPFVAESNHLSQEEVIRLHQEPEYLIYMVGFTPGFPFLGGLPPALHTPRLQTPRSLVPQGSVK